jgi:hypothetical protein
MGVEYAGHMQDIWGPTQFIGWVVAFKMELHLSQKVLEPGNVKKAFEVWSLC